MNSKLYLIKEALSASMKFRPRFRGAKSMEPILWGAGLGGVLGTMGTPYSEDHVDWKDVIRSGLAGTILGASGGAVLRGSRMRSEKSKLLDLRKRKAEARQILRQRAREGGVPSIDPFTPEERPSGSSGDSNFKPGKAKGADMGPYFDLR